MSTTATIQPPPADIGEGRLFIDGDWRDAESGGTFPVHHPATGQVLTQCAEGQSEDVELAVASARKALGKWSSAAPASRGRKLKRLADLIERDAEQLARLTTLEMGKPIREASRVDLPHAAAVFRYFGEWADKIYGETCPVDPQFLNYTLREPLGVVAAITPWNFPLVLAAWKLAPALATGNTVILKPPEQAPLASLRLGELAIEAGFKPGVLNIVPGYGPAAGAALCQHPQVDKVAFTGEHTTAQAIMRAAAGNLKKLSVECGGKSPHIIFPDADLKGALSAAFMGIFSNQGQVCNAGSRLFIPSGQLDDFVDELRLRAESIRLGDPANVKTEMGPVVSKQQFERVLGLVESGRQEGASVLCGGGASPVSDSGGYFVEPTIFGGVEHSMRIAQEEIFGPVLSVIEFQDEEDLLAKANGTPYGLAAGIWTSDLSRAHRLARSLQAGTVWVNCYNVFDLASPFGGYKISGIGKELGRHSLELYSQTKSVWIKI